MRFSRPVFQAACAAAREVLKLQAPADGVLSAFFRQHPQLGRDDRATIAETVFGLLRRKRLIERVAPSHSMADRVLACWAVILRANVRELEGVARAEQLQALAQAKARASGPLPFAVACDLPDWLIERLLPRFGEEQLAKIAASLNEPGPLDLRVNLLKRTREEAIEQLAASGVAARATSYSTAGLRVAGKPAIQRHPLFLDGSIEGQDEGSQLVCSLVGARRGEMVADFCAGAGGKTLALGMHMRSAGRLYAFDVSESRLQKLRPRVARAGLSNVQVQRLESERDVRLSRLAGKMDRVLVDAPCSGLGTLRRNPDLKWRQTPESVKEMSAKQRSILAAASKLVKAGGRLVYATCSLLEEENRQVVEEFMNRAPDFRLKPAAEALAEAAVPLEADPYLELWPHRHGTDGFFAAVLERVSP